MKLYECACCHRWRDADREAGAEVSVANLNTPDPSTGEAQTEMNWRYICPECVAALHHQGSAPERERNVID